MPKNQIQQDKFKVILTLGSAYYDENREQIKAEGETLAEALGNLKMNGLINSPGILEVKYGDKSTTRHLNVPKLKTLFNPKLSIREIMAKNIMLFLK